MRNRLWLDLADSAFQVSNDILGDLKGRPASVDQLLAHAQVVVLQGILAALIGTHLGRKP